MEVEETVSHCLEEVDEEEVEVEETMIHCLEVEVKEEVEVEETVIHCLEVEVEEEVEVEGVVSHCLPYWHKARHTSWSRRYHRGRKSTVHLFHTSGC